MSEVTLSHIRLCAECGGTIYNVTTHDVPTWAHAMTHSIYCATTTARPAEATA